MRRPHSLHNRLHCRALPRAPLLWGLLLGPLLISPGLLLASERCPGAETTLAIRACLERLLAQSDTSLARELGAIAAEARRAPEAGFSGLWEAFTREHAGGADPVRQLKSFQEQRRRICFYGHSIALQGSGFGLFVMECELQLNEALLRQWRS